MDEIGLPTNPTAAIGVIGTLVTLVGAIGALIGVLATKGVDGWLRLRKAKQDEKMEDQKFEAGKDAEAYKQATAAYEKLIGNFEARLVASEQTLREVHQELKQCREQHVKSIEEQGNLRAELAALKVHVDRLWSHDKAGRENLDHLKMLSEEKAAEIAAIRQETKQLEAKAAVTESKLADEAARVTDTGPMPVVKPE
jgi:hypothetical protein